MTGRFPRPQPWCLLKVAGSRRSRRSSRMRPIWSQKVISNLLTAKGAAMVTRCWASACWLGGGRPHGELACRYHHHLGTAGAWSPRTRCVSAPSTRQMAGGAGQPFAAATQRIEMPAGRADGDQRRQVLALTSAIWASFGLAAPASRLRPAREKSFARNARVAGAWHGQSSRHGGHEQNERTRHLSIDFSE